MNTVKRLRPSGVVSTALLCLAAAPLYLAAPRCWAAAPPKPKQLRAHPRGDTPIVIDGRLNEPGWREAPVGTDFVERTPYPGQKAPVRTEFQVLYDSDNLYVGVVLYVDRRPRDWSRARDSFDVFSDDAVSLKFDVRLDSRTTVGFVTNPAGVQLDYVAVENGSGFRREFDAVWDVATTLTSTAWTAEFILPVIALGLPAGRSVDQVGLQISRDHNARRATYDWAEMPPEFGPTAALYYGRVVGLQGLTGGNPVTLLPFVLGETMYDPRQPFTAGDLTPKAGGDVRIRFGRDVWMELTVLTDFAQVDLDNPVVNNNRFPLFFPERRPFFLSGLEVFEYGAAEFSQVFFSRRIGLTDAGETVPLWAGFKSYGSVDDFRFGLLQVLTDEQVDTPAQSFTVGRIRQNFGERGHLGLIGTLQGDVGLPSTQDATFQPNVSLGGDGAFRAFDRRLELTGFFSGTINPQDGLQRGTSGQGRIAWRGKNLQPQVAVSFVSENFDPKIGFVTRRDLVRSQVELAWVERPKAFGLQEILTYVFAQTEQQLSASEVLGQIAEAGIELEFRNGLGVGVFAARLEDFVREGFTLLDRIEVPSDRYFGESWGGYVQMSSQRNPYFNLEYNRNSAVFGGVQQNIEALVGVNLWGYARAEANGVVSFFDFDGEETIRTETVNAQLSFTPTTKLVIDLIGQANTLEARGTALVRLRWRYLDGSDAFLVYRETIPYGESEIEPERSITLKINYRLDALL